MSAATAVMSANAVIVDLLLAMLNGSVFVNAFRSTGKPCRIRFPEDADARRVLVDAHVHGRSKVLTFLAEGCEPWTERVEAVVLAAFCPGADGLCRWVALDLDAADHGATGLADPVHAARVIAERAEAAGLSSGMLVVRSRRGQGRHIFFLFQNPIALEDAVFGVAALAASAWNVASSDVTYYDAQHAFRRVDVEVASPGAPGSVEIVPRSTARPPYGWPMTLPAAGALAGCGGGVIVDPFTDRPCLLEYVPRCDTDAWTRFVIDARNELAKRNTRSAWGRRSRSGNPSWRHHHPLDRVDARTREFLDGRVTEGGRNTAAFAASANLLGCGIGDREAQQLVVSGAVACGLSEREARAAFKSACTAFRRKRGNQ